MEPGPGIAASAAPDRQAAGPRGHGGLHAVAVFEAAKGLIALLAAAGLELLGPAPLRAGLQALGRHFQLDPGHAVLEAVSGTITPGSVHLTAVVGVAYAVLRFVEAWGLWRTRAWASWLGCVSAAVYLPLDVYALARHPGWLSSAVLLVNVVVVRVLARDLLRRRRASPGAAGDGMPAS